MTAEMNYLKTPPEWLREDKKLLFNARSPANNLRHLINKHEAQGGIQNCKEYTWKVETLSAPKQLCFFKDTFSP